MIVVQNWQNRALTIILVLFTILLIYSANTLSISYKESITFYEEKNLLHYLITASTNIFGRNNIALRLPFILFYVVSVIFMYKMTKNYFKHENDRLVSILIFMFLPGIIGASLLVNNSIIVIFCLILYFYRYNLTQKHNYFLLAIFLFIDNSFAILYLTLFFYALQKKENELLVVSLVLFGVSMSFYGFDKAVLENDASHVFDLFAVYASIFSPLLVLYFLYAMYRVGLKGERSLLWYTSATVLIFSFVLSFRQKISIEDFAPYVVITIPIMTKLFLHSLRVRLPQFRTKYYIFAFSTIFLLILNVITLLFNKPIYFLLNEQEKHFAYDFHFAKEIADILKENKINSVITYDKELQSRLKFYGIGEDKTNYISLKLLNLYDKKFDIKYLNKTILSIYYVNLKPKNIPNEL